MNKLYVETPTARYPIYVENNFDTLAQRFEENNLVGRKICIVSDSNVADLYMTAVAQRLENVALTVETFVFPAGEQNKNLDTVKELYAFLVAHQWDRDSILVALGGGVTGDLVGFVAATYMRGITFVQMPTTLLSQVDSSVGGKVGVDFLDHKNMVGAFYQPAFVFANLATLKTLDVTQFNSGMGEVIKHGLIMDDDYYQYIIDHQAQIKAQDVRVMEHIVVESCKIKANVVGEDEKERGKRALLNFGHTFGHAIETLSHLEIPHGTCVLLGAVCSLYYSKLHNGFTDAQIQQMVELCHAFGLTDCLKQFDVNAIVQEMYHDKKTTNNQIRIIVLKHIGAAVSVPVTSESILKECILFGQMYTKDLR